MMKMVAMAMRTLEPGPARALSTWSRRMLWRFRGLTGTGLAQPRRGMPEIMLRRGKMTVPKMSTCLRGSRVRRPSRRAVESPQWLDMAAWAASWTQSEKSRHMYWMSTCARSMLAEPMNYLGGSPKTRLAPLRGGCTHLGRARGGNYTLHGRPGPILTSASPFLHLARILLKLGQHSEE